MLQFALVYDLMDDNAIISLVWDCLMPHGIDWNYKTEEIRKIGSSACGVPKFMSLTKARNILSASDGSREDETNKLLEFFFGPPPEFPKPTTIYHYGDEVMPPIACSHHYWVDVILFNSITQRCKHCDIKKPQEEKK